MARGCSSDMAPIVDSQRLATLADELRSLHHGPGPLVLPNAWDPVTARIVADCGAAAVATTSGGVSWAHGRADGENLTPQLAIAAIAEIAAVVRLPVSADIEGGYGKTEDEVMGTVVAVTAAGAAGVNLEDVAADRRTLRATAEQARRIAVTRSATRETGVDVVINARTDIFLLGAFDHPLEEVIARGHAYAEAGADCIFVPGLTDLPTLATLVARSPLPINVMAGPGAPRVEELAGVGVKRISVGTALAQRAYGCVRTAASELLSTGTYESLTASLGYGELNGLVVDRA
jgi:2-methylisocitrate lyase-like PEP mutase family enzyme